MSLCRCGTFQGECLKVLSHLLSICYICLLLLFIFINTIASWL
jgi:hypothetical protein